MAEKLSLFGFVRIHRSSLVNAAFVEEIHPLSTGEYMLRVRGARNIQSLVLTKRIYIFLPSRGSAPTVLSRSNASVAARTESRPRDGRDVDAADHRQGELGRAIPRQVNSSPCSPEASDLDLQHLPCQSAAPSSIQSTGTSDGRKSCLDQ
jgi:hypothetical protein